jgi:hypothetical protein
LTGDNLATGSDFVEVLRDAVNLSLTVRKGLKVFP